MTVQVNTKWMASQVHGERWGVNSKIIAQPGINHGMNVYVLSQGRKIASYKHDKKGKRACLCFTVDSDHAWFYA